MCRNRIGVIIVIIEIFGQHNGDHGVTQKVEVEQHVLAYEIALAFKAYVVRIDDRLAVYRNLGRNLNASVDTHLWRRGYHVLKKFDD